MFWEALRANSSACGPARPNTCVKWSVPSPEGVFDIEAGLQYLLRGVSSAVSSVFARAHRLMCSQSHIVQLSAIILHQRLLGAVHAQCRATESFCWGALGTNG